MTGCTLKIPTALPNSCAGKGTISSRQSLEKEKISPFLLVGDEATCNGIFQNQTGASPVPTKQKCTFKIKKSGQTEDSIPVLEVFETKTPHIVTNIEDAQKTGYPSELTRIQGRSRIRKHRRDALRGKKAPSSDMSLDEYPFASTEEGGKGAQVKPVPRKEQNIQGGEISGFYKKHDIKDGDRFKVTVIKNEDKKT